MLIAHEAGTLGVLTGHPRENAMTLCPIALTAGCKKCPIYPVCLVKRVIGDQGPKRKPAEHEKPGDK